MLQSGDRGIVYCPINRCGALYHIAARVWSIECPISFAEFLVALEARKLIPFDADPDDVAEWTEACLVTHMDASVPTGRPS
jgi:hypothetical protein